MAESERVADLLDELLAWTRFAHREALLRVLDEVLTDDRHLRAYELTDGSHTQAEVAGGAGLAQPSISALWQKWRRLGLIHEQGGRATHLVHPADVGLERSIRPRSRAASVQSNPSRADSEHQRPSEADTREQRD
jgi:hypothetical protein